MAEQKHATIKNKNIQNKIIIKSEKISCIKEIMLILDCLHGNKFIDNEVYYPPKLLSLK